MTNWESQRAGREARQEMASGSVRSADHEEALQRYLRGVAGAQERPRRQETETHRERLVVVGVGARTCSAAVDHAVAEAKLRGWPLRIIHIQPPSHPTLAADSHSRGNALLEEMADRARAQAPGTHVDTQLQTGSVAQSLLQWSATAGLVVLGSRSRGPLTDLVTGSIIAGVVAEATGPVAVIRTDSTRALPPEPLPVAVAVDGSPAADAAVALAAEEAHLRGVTLVAIHVTPNPGAPGDDQPDPLCTGTLDPETGGATGIDVVRWRTHGPVGKALVDASLRAAVLVVGARQSRGDRLGSTHQALIHHAHCPVMIVRAEAPNA